MYVACSRKWPFKLLNATDLYNCPWRQAFSQKLKSGHPGEMFTRKNVR